MTPDEDRSALVARLEYAVAQLRHAYHNLIGPDGPWDRNQRMRFADGLIAPQIVTLEKERLALDVSTANASIESPSPAAGGDLDALARETEAELRELYRTARYQQALAIIHRALEESRRG